MDARIREDHEPPTTIAPAPSTLTHARDHELSHAMLQAVLDGDYERARTLAEELRQLETGPSLAVRLVK